MLENAWHRLGLVAAVGMMAAAAFVLPRKASPPSLAGYSPAASAAELRWEQKFQAVPRPAELRADMQKLSAEPHSAGTPRQHQLALWIEQQLQADGFKTHIEHFQTLYPTPVERLVELTSPGHYQAQLREPPVPGDPTSGQKGQLPTINLYSPDGDVTAPLVYVNYGVPADYEQLTKMGVSVKGKIVIARYGHSWRGIKPKLAYQHGAVGCLIYSDPRDDGYYQGDVFPRGPFRPPQGVQRGSVMEMAIYPGDPETPGWGSVPGARRLPLNQVTNLQEIPVLPLSYGDAQPLLEALGGAVAPSGWRGALPITYHVGPGPATVHLKLKFHWGLADLYDVIGVIPGSSEPDRWVMRGNHFDAWVNGAADPDSGQSALLEEARGLGVLLHQGWRPRRTIVYAAWDGEEPSLIGSTEWAETHAAELQKKAVVYFNSDMSTKGYLDFGGSQSLQPFLNGVARGITDPKTGESLWQRDRDHRLAGAHSEAERKQVMDGADLRMPALGSGSDYSPFLQHLGIASADLSFAGDGGGGVYHSVYDDFYWYTHFGDTGFTYERALAQTIGTAVMRFADAEVLPFAFTGLADNVAEDLQQVETEYRAQKGAPGFDFHPVQRAVQRLRAAASRYDRALAEAGPTGKLHHLAPSDAAQLNQLLGTAEQQLLSAQGLPHRPWYRHLIYAPGLYTGYSVKTLPGLREAIEQKNYPVAAQQEQVLVRALDAFAARLEAAEAHL